MPRARASASLGLLCGLLGAILCGHRATAADSPRDHGAWWLKTYRPLDSSKPVARRAVEIFGRVSAAADKSGNRLPKLVLINTDGEPWAVSLPDGSVVLTRGALRLTLEAAPGSDGEARLAFVIGHELAHLAKDDFWHASAFSAVSRFATGEERQSTLGLLQTTTRDLQTAELQADGYGLLYMTWAGYSPQTLLAQEHSFFEHWAVATGVAGDLAHPTAANRGAFLHDQLAQVNDDLDFFRFGVWLLELGRYEDALLLLERFKDLFASREVFTDIGLAHYQLALRELAACDGQAAVRFALPVQADPVTLAERSRRRGVSSTPLAEDDACRQAVPFREHLDAARRYLELAAERDAQYLPARIDLIAARLLAGQHAAALEAAEAALKIAPNSPEALNGKALGLYLFGLESRFDTADAALKLLEQARAADPRAPAPLYNQAAILDQRGRAAAARETWAAFLALEPNGPHAELARQRLGVMAAASGGETPPPGPTSPLALGETAEASAGSWRGFTRKDFVLGDFRGAFWRSLAPSTAVSAMMIGSALELVESARPQPLARQDALRRYGSPLRTVITPRGAVLVYPGFAFEYSGDTLLATLYFATASANPRR